MSWKPTFCAPVAASPESCRERIGEIAAGEAEQRHEGGRQRAAVVEEIVEGIGDIELVDAQGSGAERCPARYAGAGGAPGALGWPSVAVRFRMSWSRCS